MRSLRRICNPANKNAEGIDDPTAHLSCYRINEPRREPQEMFVANQFGMQKLEVGRADSMCLPAEMDGVASDLNINHFKCYKAREADRELHFTERLVDVEDQFQRETARVKRARLLCNPVDKNGEGVVDPETHLVCYDIRGAAGPHGSAGAAAGRPQCPRWQASVVDQFRDEPRPLVRGDCSRVTLLCVPSRKVDSFPAAPTVTFTRSTTDRNLVVRRSDRPAVEFEFDFVIADVQNPASKPSEPTTSFSTPPYFAKTYVFLQTADSEIIEVFESNRQKLPSGTTREHRIQTIDADSLAPGAYTVQAMVVVAPASQLGQKLEHLLAPLLAGDHAKVPQRFATSPAAGFQVLDDEPEKVAMFESLISSGQPNRVLRGLSQLVMRHRNRGRFDLAAAAVAEVIHETAGEPDLARMHPLFRTWSADDAALAGAPGRAEELLDEAASLYPEAGVFGVPFPAFAGRQKARIWRSVGNTARQIAALDAVIDAYPDIPSSLEDRMARGKAHLEAGNWDAARADFAAIVNAHEDCTGPVPPPEPIVERASLDDDVGGQDSPAICPSLEDAEEASGLIAILDSDRSWFRATAGEVARELKAALEAGDLGALDALASPHGFRFGTPGAHSVVTNWSDLPRSFFANTLTPGQYEVFIPDGIDDLALETIYLGAQAGSVQAPGGATVLLMAIERTPWGHEWGALGGLYGLGPAIPHIPGGIGPKQPKPPETLSMKASWAPGAWMRAGGWDASFDSFWDNPIVDILSTFAPSDHCGAGIPGYFYNTNDTHKDKPEENKYNRQAIDWVQGATLFCVPDRVPGIGGKCVPNTAAAILEALNAVANLPDFSNDVTENPSYLDPIHLGHAGLVVNADFSYRDGSKAGANALDIAAWTYPPTSVQDFLNNLQALRDDGDGEPDFGHPECNEGDAIPHRLCSIDPLPQYWVRHLHMAHQIECPECQVSTGMWLDQGTMVGKIDDTGENSLMSHLHLTVYKRQYPDRSLQDPAGTSFMVKNEGWKSVGQMVEGRFLFPEDNGKCIRSTNSGLGDIDEDGVPDGTDNCAIFKNPEQLDADGDSVGDACDEDRDNDGVLNADDRCPDDFNPVAFTTIEIDDDGDGIPNECDSDVDGDGVSNLFDRCRGADDTADVDGDFIPDACDPDADGDGATLTDGLPDVPCPPQPDRFELDPLRIGDYDEDGIDDLVEVANGSCPCDHVNPGCALTPAIQDLGTLHLYMLR